MTSPTRRRRQRSRDRIGQADVAEAVEIARQLAAELGTQGALPYSRLEMQLIRSWLKRPDWNPSPEKRAEILSRVCVSLRSDCRSLKISGVMTVLAMVGEDQPQEIEARRLAMNESGAVG